MSKDKQRISFSEIKRRIRLERHLLILVATCIVLFLSAILVCLFHVNTIIDCFQDNTYEALVSRTDLSTNHFAEEFGSRRQLIQASADLLKEKKEPSQTEIVDALITLETSGRFDYAIFVSNRGVKYRSSGGLISTSTARYAQNMDYSGKVFVFKNFDPKGMEDELCFGAPIVVDGIAIGYLIGANRISELFSMFTQIKDASVDSRYLIDSHGSIMAGLVGTEIINSGGKNFYDDILRYEVADSYEADVAVEDIINNISNGEINTLNVKLDNDEACIIFKEVPNSDGWGLMYLVKDSDIKNSIKPMLKKTYIAMLAIVLLVTLMIFFIARYVLIEQRKIHELAYVDDLTKAPNENAFKEKVHYLLKEYPDVPYLMACFDIMNFRYINEGYGHQKADVLLNAMVRACEEAYSYNECYARLTADRFICLAVDDGREEERKKLFMDILTKAANEVHMNYPIRVKTGLYFIKNRKEPVAEMIDKVNMARKSVNSASPILVEEYKDSLMEETHKQEQIESRMEDALRNGEFVPFLQPKWDMKNDRIYGAEALVRWRKADGTIIPPGDFIPIFERNGFVEKIDFYMLEYICKYLRNMIDSGRTVYPVSINQSRYLMYNPDYISNVQRILIKYRIPKGLVEFELTETVFFHEKDRMFEMMNQLKNFNMNLSIDDFGSGYSSLNLLREIPFDVLKIDRGFLDESAQSESGKWILRKIVEMADGLNLKVICEGVETREQAEMLLDIGCVYAQGFLYSRPIPIEEFIERYNVLIDTFEIGIV